ncbi:MAG: chromosomal replication initiator protein DnaA [Pygmaiobacter massiliensis]|nr:chromosomal replication initiator protein DnaA [Pygmaiobacter massiliensis]
MDSFDEVFTAVKEYCRERLAEATYRVFIQDLTPLSFEGGVVTISARTDFLKKIVDERYQPLIKDGFRTLLGFDVDLEFVVPKAAAAAAAESVPVPAAPAGSYAFTFENFIVGSTNRFAHAAAQAVAANPSGAYNPLVIYGDSGLGKTHLLNAIRIEISRNFPDYNIVYVDGEAFTNEIISAIRNSSTADFHQKYRAADVLFVDDIQFIAGKESTQEEFFHTFNTLYNAGKQIVLATDRPPKEIKSLEDRIRTRMEWGLIADIQPPDFETRVAIIRRKADLLGLDISDEVAEYIANNLKNNIRQLEGAVKKLNAYYTLEGIPPVVGAAQNAIKDILSESQPVPVTIEKIISEVARTYNISPADIRSMKRSSNVSEARQTSMYAIQEITGMTRQEIGREFGGRDHSTVVYAIKQVKKQMEKDPRYKEVVEDIIKNART